LEAGLITDPKTRVTAIVAGLSEEAATDQVLAEDLFPLVYDELRRLAAGYMNRETPGHTLQPTALVHEAYLKLVDQTRANWKGKTHFYAVGARVMRRLLVDHARGRGAQKRGAGWRNVTLAGVFAPSENADLDPFFGGLTVEQVAEVLEVSKRTVDNDWRHARAWLQLELSRGDVS
jgi:RNA polymerase sigma factor (TIGR02999 family)